MSVSQPQLPAYARTHGYSALGLAHNPFIAELEAGVAAALWIERAGIPQAPQAGQQCLIQLIGPKGAGKTSLLLHWRAIAPGPYHYTAPGLARWRFPPIAPLVYWDEIDRMAQPVRLAAFLLARWRRCTIVAGTHVDLAKHAHRLGLSSTTITFAPLSAHLLQEWAALRIAAAALPNHSPQLTLDEPTAAQIVAEADCSWRDAAVLLHRWAAQQANLHSK